MKETIRVVVNISDSIHLKVVRGENVHRGKIVD